jgi:hypothetical protein
MGTILEFLPLASVIATAILAFVVCSDERKTRIAVEERFSVVLDADVEAERILKDADWTAMQILVDANAQADELLSNASAFAQAQTARAHESEVRATELRGEIELLQRNYIEKRKVYDRLVAEVAIFDEKLAFAELGVYEPHFEFTDSEQFKAAIIDVRSAQKKLVSEETAVVCSTKWTVDGSVSRGKTMTGRNIRLTLRAFNNECEAAIANTRWNNVNAMEKRIVRAKEQIDKLNESNSITITADYLMLKLRELRLTHECREKLKNEREERTEVT